MLGLIAGLVIVAAGIWTVYKGYMDVRHGVRVQGVVIDVYRQRAGDGRINFPILEFRTADGRVVRAKSRVGGVGAHPGKPVPVLYDPDKPDSVVIDTFAGRANWLPLLFLAMGIGFTVWGVCTVV